MIVNCSNLTVNNCTFDGNSANIGGAIFSDFESRININNSTFTFNQAKGCNELDICFGLGGALFIGGNSTVIIHNSTFDNNTSDVDGGMAGVFNANLFIFGSQACNNAAVNDGGVIATFVGSYLHVETTMFNSNVAQCNGGVITTTRNTTTAISHCIFRHNSAGKTDNTPVINIKSHGDNLKCNNAVGNGGVAYAEYSASVIVGEALFVNNSATGDGGVMYAQKQSYLDIKNCTILNNSAVSGGVLFARESTNTFISNNSCLKGNIAESHGGVVFLEDVSNITINDSIISKNDARHSGGVISADNSWIKIHGTTLRSNRATIFGGVIRTLHSSSVLVSDSTFDGNYAGNNGGVFDCFYAASIGMYKSNFMHNFAQLKGGVLVMSNENSKNSGVSTINEVLDCTFTNNSAPNGGVFSLKRKVNMTIQSSNFNENTAKSDGGILHVLIRCSITIYNSSFNDNVAVNNGVLLASYMCNITIYGSQFSNNVAGFNGGAIYVVNKCNTTIIDCKFIGNQANDSGGTIYERKSSFVIIKSSIFTQSIAFNSGGVVHAHGNSTVVINDSDFTNNAADYGGVLRVYDNSKAKIAQCTFKINQASISGGAMAAYKSSTLAVEDSSFSQNVANIGGVAVVFQMTLPSDHGALNGADFGHNIGRSIVDINKSVFCKNSADYGGVIYVQGSTATVSSSTLNQNTARYFGGVISANANSTVTLNMNNISNNTAKKRGGVMSLNDGSFVNIAYNTFMSNDAQTKGGVLTILESEALISTSTFKSSTVARGTGGVIYASNSSLQIANSSFMENNASSSGGAVHVDLNTTMVTVYCNFTNNTAKGSGGALFFENNSQGTIAFCLLQQNVANSGGAIALKALSNCFVDNHFEREALTSHRNTTVTQILSNTASISGGGIYLYKSNIHFGAETNVYCNQAHKSGGGIHASKSVIEFGSNIKFENNTAKKGGGVSLTTSYLCSDTRLIQSSVSFVFNKASTYGGALFVLDNPYFCSEPYSLNPRTARCFFQNVTQDLMMNFSNNTANITGDDLYGGQLDRCSINNDTNSTGDGITRWKVISNLRDLNTVSSQPARVCQCKNSTPHCDERIHSIHIKQGEAFKVPLVVVDQVVQPVNSVVLSILNRSESDYTFSQTRAFHLINASCYDLEFNISFPTSGTTNELTIIDSTHVNTSCEDVILSNITIFIHVVNCSCAPGFMSAGIRGVCYCTCDKRDEVFSRYIKNCNYEKLTVTRKGVFWITYLNDSDTDGYLFFPYCPVEYCQLPGTSVNVNLSQPNGSDAQCANNRIGLLCGSCPHNYSLSLGSAKCIVCPNNWHGLLVVIVLAACIAGIVLVLSLLVFNLTVAVGTLNSIIFYANIIYANKSIYFGHSHVLLIQIITSWLNLDIGFDTCFFDGMDTYAKTWLQLAFPMYIIALIIALILISSCSSRFSNMIGRKDPVATLATLILLSYTKLLQIVIASSSYVKVEYPNGTSTSRWTRDASIEFGTGKSIALICVALFILLFGFLYTILVFSWQCLVKCPRSRLLGWTRNHKLSSFISTYHTPHSAKHRYWPGLLLLIRVTVYLTAAFSASSDQPITLLCTIVMMCCLLFYKTNLGIRVYRNWLLNAMESFMHFNILIFAVFTMFTFISSSAGDGSKETLQRVVANLSIGSVLLLLLFVIVFHMYRYGSAKFYTLVERTCPCRLFKGYDRNRNHWKLLDNPLLDVIDDPRDDSGNTNYYTRAPSSSMVLPTRSTVSMADAEGTSVAVSTLDQSTDESINPSQPTTTSDSKPSKTSSFPNSNNIHKADLSSLLSPNKKFSGINCKQPLLV
jgi:predicted outer membrane repeat protein